MTGRPYDIEADWILWSGCNYRCSYCFWPVDALKLRPAPPAEVDHLVSFFDETSLTWLLHLTGGEPFLYPRFVEMVDRLTKTHLVSVNSNLSSDRVFQFAEEIDPARVPFLNCGFHVGERENRGRIEDFVNKIGRLRAAGFNAFVTYVLYPPLFDRAVRDFAELADKGVPLIPKAFRGTWEGKCYPGAYTQAEKRVFLDLSAQAEAAYADMWARMPTPPTINPFLDRDLVLNGVQDHRGKLCAAGRNFVRIRENGDIQSCGSLDVIGNVAQGTFQRRTGPSPCQEVECPYFCYKYLVGGADAANQPPAPLTEGDRATAHGTGSGVRQLLGGVRSLASGVVRQLSRQR